MGIGRNFETFGSQDDLAIAVVLKHSRVGESYITGLVVSASTNSRNSPEVLPRCQAINTSHVASASAMGTSTAFGILRWEMKIGFTKISPSSAATESPSVSLVISRMAANRGLNLPNRRQNSVIFWLYPGAPVSGTRRKWSFFNCENEMRSSEASGWLRGRTTILGTVASLQVKKSRESNSLPRQVKA